MGGGRIVLADSEDERDEHMAAASSASLFFSVSVFETKMGIPNVRRHSKYPIIYVLKAELPKEPKARL